LPSVELPMASEVAGVEKENELLVQELLQMVEEIVKLKEVNLSLQQKIDSHVCIIVVAKNSKAENLTQVRTELHITENELKKKNTYLENVVKIIKTTE